MKNEFSLFEKKYLDHSVFFNQEIEDKTLTKMSQVVQFLFLKLNVHGKLQRFAFFLAF